MSAPLHVLRLALILVLAAGPLVSSALAAEDGVWSSAWANPFNGTIPPAEEEEPIHVEPEMAKGESLTGHAWLERISSTRMGRLESRDVPPEPPYDGAPTPPPDAC